MTCDEDDVTNVWFGYPPRVHLNNTWNKNRLLFNSTKNENEKNKKITSYGSEAEERERGEESTNISMTCADDVINEGSQI